MTNLVRILVPPDNLELLHDALEGAPELGATLPDVERRAGVEGQAPLRDRPLAGGGVDPLAAARSLSSTNLGHHVQVISDLFRCQIRSEIVILD